MTRTLFHAAALPAAAGAAASPSAVEATFDVADMSCASCVRRLEKALKAVPGVSDVTVNLASETAFVRFDPQVAPPERIAEAGTAAGYPTRHQRPDVAPTRHDAAVSQVDTAVPDARFVEDGTKRRERGAAGTGSPEWQRQRRNVILAVALTLPVFLVEMATHVGMPVSRALGNWLGDSRMALLEAVLSTAVLAGPGRQFFAKGWLALRRAAPDMNTLVALGAGAAWAFSLLTMARPEWFPMEARHRYFETAAVIVTFILIGRYLEARAKGRTGDAIRALLALRPDTAHQLRDNGDAEAIASWPMRDVPASTLAVGDVILVRPGERIPADAVLLDGTSYVDESMLTGESMPVEKSLARATGLTGGTVNGDGILRARVSRVGADATLARIIALVQRAQGAKLPIQQVVDRVTAWFVPAVLLAATLTFVAWMVWGPNVSYAVAAAVAVLIVACPCAMGLATPTSIIVGAGRAARLGVLFRQGDALQTLQACKVIAFDKTGTLTLGRPAVTAHHWCMPVEESTLWPRLSALEALSAHPLATAIVAHSTARSVRGTEGTITGAAIVSDFISETGHGVAGTIEGHRIALGNAAWMTRQGMPFGSTGPTETNGHADNDAMAHVVAGWRAQMHTVLYVGVDGRVVGALAVADPIRDEARTVVSALRARGLRVAMVTGDAAATAHAVAAALGIDDVRADVLPDGKVAAVEALRTQYGTLAFVGDGMNDAPALAQADVGIALGSGSDVAIESANIVLAHGAIHGVADAFAISRATMRNIRQNLLWAFGYNVLLVPLAAGLAYPIFGVLLSPMLSAAAMALSSVFVLSNALRLRFIQPVLPAAAAGSPHRHSGE